MERIDEELVLRVDRYIESLFVPVDPVLLENLQDAGAAGMPPINVSPNEGKLLYLVAKIAGARRVLEVGTLGGYSTTWLARALPADGKVVTLEILPAHAEVARRNIERAGLSAMVEIQVGDAVGLLQRMAAGGEEPFDLVFIDADKPGYVEYLHLVLGLSRPGTVILADNVIRNGLVLEDSPADANVRAAKAFNLAISSHPRLESIVVPIFRNKLDGLAVSIVR